jgi:hypothetical protein
MKPEDNMKNTLIVNLYGGPGSGKSTGAAYIFSRLKMDGIDAELVTEFAKDKVWEENKTVFNCQFYISGKQAFRIARCFGKVDVIVTDSPIRLGKIYADMNGEKYLGRACIDEADKYRDSSIDIILRRVKPYNPNGRNQTEEESDAITRRIRYMLEYYKVPHLTFDGDQTGYNLVFQLIKEKLLEIKGKESTMANEQLDLFGYTASNETIDASTPIQAENEKKKEEERYHSTDPSQCSLPI